MKQKNKGRMTLTLLLSASVFVVTLATLLIIGLVLLVIEHMGLLAQWMEHASILSFFAIIAASSLAGGTLLALLLGTFPLRSINQMTAGLHSLASGDYKARILPGKILSSIPPVRDMIDSFNTTAAELEGTEVPAPTLSTTSLTSSKPPLSPLPGLPAS